MPDVSVVLGVSLRVIATVGFGRTTVGSGEGIGEMSPLGDIVGTKSAVGVGLLVGDADGFGVDVGLKVGVAV